MHEIRLFLLFLHSLACGLVQLLALVPKLLIVLSPFLLMGCAFLFSAVWIRIAVFTLGALLCLATKPVSAMTGRRFRIF